MRSSAFTILEKRQTFLEEALFVRIAARDRSLLEKWRLPLDELLGFTLTHELGHAMCRETDEARLEGYAPVLILVELMGQAQIRVRPPHDILVYRILPRAVLIPGVTSLF